MSYRKGFIIEGARTPIALSRAAFSPKHVILGTASVRNFPSRSSFGAEPQNSAVTFSIVQGKKRSFPTLKVV
jgi:hypothetical protein